MKSLANTAFNAFLLCLSLWCAPAALAEPENPPEYGNKPQLPNDTEQKASYCLAVKKLQYSQVSGSVEGLVRRVENETNPGIKKILMEGLSTARTMEERDADNIRRLQSYLLPRIPYLDPLALQAAYSRGEADFNQQSASGLPRLCMSSCQHQGSAFDAQCMEKCMLKDDVNQRIFQCKDLSFLPY